MAFDPKPDTGHTVQRAWDSYDVQRKALLQFHGTIESQFKTGLTPINAPFAGMTLQEYREAIDAIFLELDHATSFSLLSAAEAELWRSYKYYGKGKDTGKIPIGLRRLFARHGERLKDVERILDVWRLNKPQPAKSKFSAFKAAMKYRHWIAHGRHWTLLAQCYSPLNVYQICVSMVDEMSP